VNKKHCVCGQKPDPLKTAIMQQNLSDLSEILDLQATE